MKILITFLYLNKRTGAELYVYDVALQLLKLGHTPIIFIGKNNGPLLDEVRKKGIPVTMDLETISLAPDIIMGNSQEQLILALLYFPNTPSVFVGHDRFEEYASPPKLSRVYRYITVSENIYDGFVYENNIPKSKILNIPNAVDLEKFKPRSMLPNKPSTALIFSNHAKPNSYITTVIKACENFNITVDIVGSGVNNIIETPENLLPKYDLVFAKGRCALEAACVGCAVILCDVEGLGPIVSSQNIAYLRNHNFGWRMLQNSLTVEGISEQILLYNPQDTFQITQYLQKTSSLKEMTLELAQLFNKIIAESHDTPALTKKEELIELYHYFKENNAKKSKVINQLKSKNYHTQLEIKQIKQSKTYRIIILNKNFISKIKRLMGKTHDEVLS